MKRKRQSWNDIMAARDRMTYVQESSEEIILWAKQMSWNDLIEVPCKPEPGCDDGACFINVEKVIGLHGGSACYGYMFVEIPAQAVITEAHAVWKDPAGNLIDVTDKAASVNRILFAPDSRVQKDRGGSRDEYLLLSKDPRVHRVLEFEIGRQEWAAKQILALQEHDCQDLSPINFASLRQLITNADLPGWLAGHLLSLDYKFLGKLPKAIVPQDILRLIEKRENR